MDLFPCEPSGTKPAIIFSIYGNLLISLEIFPPLRSEFAFPEHPENIEIQWLTVQVETLLAGFQKMF